ncbi:VOC family protein [Tritonibacter mobilis]|uniref:VOC family protein n=1 Tax=Tritonibacter mobilis TaxID=379347 RepID=UPI00080696B4|nr:VOC family protein [Tritonibacter mobilis]
MNIIAHVEIPVRDLERAMTFYSTVFEIAFSDITSIHGNRMAFFPFTEGQDGASGALAEGEIYVPTHEGALLYFSVNDIDAVLQRATNLGQPILLAKTALVDGGFVAEIEDSEGNRIAVQML